MIELIVIWSLVIFGCVVVIPLNHTMLWQCWQHSKYGDASGIAPVNSAKDIGLRAWDSYTGWWRNPRLPTFK